MDSPVKVEVRDDIACVIVDNPPVNALGHAVREGLVRSLTSVRDDDETHAVVICCEGRTFFAGADITEFGKPPRAPSLSDVIALIESFDKPVVAAIHGTALGGGLEVAMACHYRVADAEARFGQPEVKLGILPGAGGTQRLPRLVGPVEALSMIVTGSPVGAGKALALGLVDEVHDDNLVAHAMKFAADKAHSGERPRLVRDHNEKIASVDRAAFEAEASALLKKSKGLQAPAACVEAVRNALDMPFDEALASERRLFMELVAGTESRALRHLFFAEREAARVRGVGREDTPRAVRRAAVIGAGTMGGGIAMALASAGIGVTLVETSREALDRGIGVITRNYATSVARGSLAPEARDERMGRIGGTTDYASIADVDLVIEAAFEDMAVKREVFEALDRIVRPGALLATNTSYLDVDAIAGFTNRPADVVGMHFFSPANVMRMLEIVRGRETAPDVLATAMAVGRQMGKVPVVVGVCHGFVGNRMLAARSAEIEPLLLAGAAPQAVDRAFTDFGFAMGPLQMADLAGLDIGWRNRKALGRTAPVFDALCEAGRFGQKTGRGVYRYAEGSRESLPDPEVEALIAAKASEGGVARRDISSVEIIERTLHPMVNEGVRILAEGIAERSSDIDLVWVHGYGFPIARGGPMFWADREGLPGIVDRLRHWHAATGNDIFTPAPLLVELAANGGTFSAWRRNPA